MPVENELKYLLPRDFDPCRLQGWQKHDIRQAYLDDGPRIRQIDSDYLFTYKKWIPQAGEMVEIEVGISKDDFDLLWTQRGPSLEKTRYVKHLGPDEWVVDFLRDASGEVFVVLAEVEMPRHATAPQAIPSEIAGQVLVAPAAGDVRFSNRALADPSHAAGLYQDLSAQA